MNSEKSLCELTYCKVPRIEGKDRCILHQKTADKDLGEFDEALKKYYKYKPNDLIGIYFPNKRPYLIKDDIKEKVRFSGCHFPREFKIKEKNIAKKFTIVSCDFKGPVRFNRCNFNGHVIIGDNDYYNSVSFFKCDFNNNIIFMSNDFKNGVKVHKNNFNNDKYCIFRNCKLEYSFFYESDISNMDFIHCNWRKKYMLAEEQYDLRIPTKFTKVGLPDTYFNRLISQIEKITGNKFNIIPFIYPNEYKRQKKINENNGSLYIKHTGWNDAKMAANSYRKLRLKYSEQGEPEIAGHFFFRERVNQRRQKKLLKRVINYIFQELLFGYGEKPFRVITSSGLIIFMFSIIYKYSNLLVNGNEKIVNDLFSSIYFSTVTFTTLGYGDYHPIKWLRFIAASESIIGAILIALFVVTLTRKLIR